MSLGPQHVRCIGVFVSTKCEQMLLDKGACTSSFPHTLHSNSAAGNHSSINKRGGFAERHLTASRRIRSARTARIPFEPDIRPNHHALHSRLHVLNYQQHGEDRMDYEDAGNQCITGNPGTSVGIKRIKGPWLQFSRLWIFLNVKRVPKQ